MEIAFNLGSPLDRDIIIMQEVPTVIKFPKLKRGKSDK
jgi:hypothetical protein